MASKAIRESNNTGHSIDPTAKELQTVMNAVSVKASASVRRVNSGLLKNLRGEIKAAVKQAKAQRITSKITG